MAPRPSKPAQMDSSGAPDVIDANCASSGPSQPSTLYHTAPFVQSTLRHLEVTSKGELANGGTQKTGGTNGSTGSGNTVEGNRKNNNEVNLKASSVNDVTEYTPLLSEEECNNLKEPPTLHECSDEAQANDITNHVHVVTESGEQQTPSASEELSSLLANSNVLSGGISSPSTISWMIKVSVDLYHRYPNFAHAIVFLAAFCLVFEVYAVSQGEAILTQASYVDVESVSVVGVSEFGIELHVATSIKFDYSVVHNWLNRFIGVMAGVVLGTVVITPLAPIDAFVAIDNFEDMHRLVRVIPPEKTKINLANGRVSALEIDSTISVVSTSAVIVTNKLLELRSAGLDFVNVTVTGSYNFDVSSALKNYKDITYDFEETVGIDLFHALPGNIFEVLDVTLSGAGDELDASATFSTRAFSQPLELKMDAMDWTLKLPSCNAKQLKAVGGAQTDPIEIEPLSKVSGSARIQIPELPSDLLKPCPGDTRSAFNKFVIAFLSNDLTRGVYVTAKASDHYSMPMWLQFILERVNVPLPVGISALDSFVDTDPLREWTSSDVFVRLDQESQTVVVSALASAVLQCPLMLQDYPFFKISGFKGRSTVSYNSSEMANFRFEDWQAMKINYTRDEVLADVKIQEMELEIVDPETVSTFVQTFLSGSATELGFDSDLDVDLMSPIADTTLYDLPISGPFSLPGYSADGLFAGINATIADIFLVQSTPKSLALLLDLEIQNPLPVGLDTQGAMVDLFFAAEDIVLGQIRTHDIPVVSPNGVFNTSVLLEIEPEILNREAPERSVAKLEKFLSGYLSGNETDITLLGHAESIPTMPALSAVVDGMSLSFTLPEAGYAGPESNGFIVSSTMHIMTSEIEFVVYNPVANSEVVIEILKAQASFEGTTLGHLERQELLVIPPGLYKTPRLPITYASGIGGNILKKALNGELKVHGDAIFRFGLDEFAMDLVYSGNGLSTNVRL